MPSIQVDLLTFVFPNNWLAAKYDDWSYYRKQFQRVCGSAKAIDIVAVEPSACCWCIEVKDYRRNQRTNPSDLADEVAIKVRDSLAGLFAAQCRANDATEQNMARSAVRCPDVRVVVHLEQPANPSRLFPQVVKPADVVQRLKQLLKAIDPRPRVVDMTTMQGLGWTVS